jgi:chemoreceptor zinc-binding protein
MDFDHAIAAHSDWKRKLSKYLANPDHSLKPEEVGLDNRCELGKWLVGEGKQFAKFAEYKTVVSDHTKFHKVAADIVHRANVGQKVSEEVVLGAKSEFASASSAVVRSIMALKAKVAAPVGA